MNSLLFSAPKSLKDGMGSLGEILCALTKKDVPVDVLFFMVVLVEVPTLVQRLRKEHLLVQSSADLAVFQGHQCHEATEIVDILCAE